MPFTAEGRRRTREERESKQRRSKKDPAGVKFKAMTQSISTIRRATVADAGLLSELGARTFSDTFAADNKPEDMAAYLAVSFTPARQTEELADPLSIFLIAEIDKVAVGYAQLHAGRAPDNVRGAKPIEIVRIYASQEWLGRRVGEALMRACISEPGRQAIKRCGLVYGSGMVGRVPFTANGSFVMSESISFNWAPTRRMTY